MTLQVGLVGQDGIVMASDRLMSQWEGTGFSQIMTSKFLCGPKVICCWSGDTVSEHAANNIRTLDCEGEKEDVRELLKNAGDNAWREIGEPAELNLWQPTRKVIVASPASPFPLWVVQVSRSSTANEVLDKVIAGDDKNTARHFINNYVPWPPLPISRLIILAAHIILSGGKENPSGVGGLEVLMIPWGASPTFLSSDQEQELKRLSDALGETIKEKLLRTFDYC